MGNISGFTTTARTESSTSVESTFKSLAIDPAAFLPFIIGHCEGARSPPREEVC